MYINPLSDIVFKYLLGREETKDLLLSFINSVLEDSDLETMQSLEIRNPFNLKEFKTDKTSILDIKAIDNKGKIYNIEVQNIGDEVFVSRSLYYWAKLYAGQLEESEDYNKLQPVICINVLSFDLIEKPDLLHSCFMAFDKRDKDLLLSENFQIHFIELKKYQNNLNKLKKTLNDWVCYFLNEGREEEIVKTVLEHNPLLKKVHREYKKFTLDDQMREIYEYQEKKRKDEKSLINSFYKKGIKEGIKEGEIKGEKKGKIETAQNMLKMKADIHFIHQATGLSIEEIKKLTPSPPLLEREGEKK